MIEFFHYAAIHILIAYMIFFNRSNIRFKFFYNNLIFKSNFMFSI